jgi:prepilin-type N-terminal cleavage/methylation domain-containing protein
MKQWNSKVNKNEKKYFKLQITNYQNGFTLVELLVSVFIIAMITGIFLVNYHSSDERQKLIMAVQQAASDIRLAQSYALGAKKFNGSIPAGGWGFHAWKWPGSSYEIFADEDGDKNYLSESAEMYKKIILPDGIVISDVSDCSFSGSGVDIFFIPPKPDNYILWDSYEKDNVCVIFKDSNNTTKTIQVNSFGLVDVID